MAIDNRITPRPAKALVEGEEKALIQEAFDLEIKIKIAAAKVHQSEWELAEHLYAMAEIKGWERLGVDFNEFLAQPEISLSRSQYFRLVQSWRHLVVIRQVPAPRLAKLEPSKVHEVLPAIAGGKVKLDQGLSDAEVMGFRDLREKYRPENIQRHGQEPDNSTPLDAEAEPKRSKCPLCGQWATEDMLPPLRADVIDSTAIEDDVVL